MQFAMEYHSALCLALAIPQSFRFIDQTTLRAMGIILFLAGCTVNQKQLATYTVKYLHKEM